jgi:hypothetical protein
MPDRSTTAASTRPSKAKPNPPTPRVVVRLKLSSVAATIGRTLVALSLEAEAVS